MMNGTAHVTPDEWRKQAKTAKEREKFDALPNWKRKVAPLLAIKHDEWKTEEEFDKLRQKRVDEKKAAAEKKTAAEKPAETKPEPAKETSVKVEATVTPQPVRVDVNPAAPHVPIIMIQPTMAAPAAAVSSVTEADDTSGTSEPSAWYGITAKAVMWVQAAVCGAALWALFGNKIVNAIGGL